MTATSPDHDHPHLRTDLHVEATYRLTEALVEAENRMRRRVELLSEVVFETDRNGRLVFLNSAWTAMTGRPVSSSLGRLLEDFIHEDDRHELARVLGCPPADGVATRQQMRVLRVDGGFAWVEVSATCQGGIVVGALHDVTRRKHDQDELAKLSLVASSTDNLVIITDAQGRTEWVNDAFVRRTGYTLDEMLGRKPGHVLQGPGSDRAAIERVKRHLMEGRSFQDELLNFTKDGAPYWVTFHITPIRTADGTVQRFVSVQTDSTRLKQTQRELEAAKERAETASQAKSLFLATMSHEMRTPLNVILGSTDLALEDVTDPMALRDHLARINDNAEVLLRLISDVLDVSKIEAGQIDVERIPFALRSCLQRAVSPVEERARAKGLRFDARYDPSLPDHVLGDPDRLRQIVSNLAENAVKFTDEGYVLVEAVRGQGGPGSASLEIRVSDSGTGISPEAQARVFDRFEQGDSSTTRRKGGAGLGLHIVKQLVHALGGDVRLRSVVGSGTEFVVRLPLESVPGSAPDRRAERLARPAGAPSGIGEPGRLRVLVAEDTDANYSVLAIYLSKAGYAVSRAVDGHAALATAREGFDLILMDVEMPGMDGLEATAAVRRMEAELGRRPVPIIALTAHAIQGYRERCLSAGCTAYLSKPIRKAALLEAVNRALDDAQDGEQGGSGRTPDPETSGTGGAAGARPVVAVEPELAHLIPEFLDYCQAERGRIMDALERQDWKLAARLGHSLKGAGPSVGFETVGACGSRIESAARAGDAALARLALEALADHLGAVRIVTKD